METRSSTQWLVVTLTLATLILKTASNVSINSEEKLLNDNLYKHNNTLNFNFKKDKENDTRHGDDTLKPPNETNKHAYEKKPLNEFGTVDADDKPNHHIDTNHERATVLRQSDTVRHAIINDSKLDTQETMPRGTDTQKENNRDKTLAFYEAKLTYNDAGNNLDDDKEVVDRAVSKSHGVPKHIVRMKHNRLQVTSPSLGSVETTLKDSDIHKFKHKKHIQREYKKTTTHYSDVKGHKLHNEKDLETVEVPLPTHKHSHRDFENHVSVEKALNEKNRHNKHQNLKSNEVYSKYKMKHEQEVDEVSNEESKEVVNQKEKGNSHHSYLVKKYKDTMKHLQSDAEETNSIIKYKDKVKHLQSEEPHSERIYKKIYKHPQSDTDSDRKYREKVKHLQSDTYSDRKYKHNAKQFESDDDSARNYKEKVKHLQSDTYSVKHYTDKVRHHQSENTYDKKYKEKPKPLESYVDSDRKYREKVKHIQDGDYFIKQYKDKERHLQIDNTYDRKYKDNAKQFDSDTDSDRKYKEKVKKKQNGDTYSVKQYPDKVRHNDRKYKENAKQFESDIESARNTYSKNNKYKIKHVETRPNSDETSLDERKLDSYEELLKQNDLIEKPSLPFYVSSTPKKLPIKKPETRHSKNEETPISVLDDIHTVFRENHELKTNTVDLNATLERLASSKILDLLTERVASQMLKKLQKRINLLRTRENGTVIEEDTETPENTEEIEILFDNYDMLPKNGELKPVIKNKSGILPY